MANRLKNIIKECQAALGAERSQDISLTVLLRLAAVRCFEEQLWCTPSQLSPSIPLENLCQPVSTINTLLAQLTDLPASWEDRWLFQLPAAALNIIRRHLTISISPEEWRAEHILDWIYQALLDDTPEQKQHGRFYTPESVADAIVTQAFDLSGKEHGAECAILDLGCGAGSFALRAFDRLSAWYQQDNSEGGHAQDIPRQILERHLFLVDNDPHACQLAAINLYLKAKRFNPDSRIQRVNVICTDALQRWEERAQKAPDPVRRLFTRKYDLVVGNPPYSVINQLRAAPEIIRQYKSYHSAAFKINTFPLFIERGIELLRPHGILGMIIPNTLLTQMYFEPLRQYLLDATRILRILDTKRLFDTAFVENCILLVQKEPDAALRSQQRIECVTMPSNGPLKQTSPTSSWGNVCHIRQQHFEHAPYAMFRVHLTEPVFELIETISRDTPKLGDLCECHDGVNPGNAKHKLIVTEQLDETCHKVLNGKNIGRYWLRWDGLYVRYDRRVLNKGDNVRWGYLPALNGAKILTRQTADRIIGAFEPGDYYTTNSIHTTILKEGIRDFDLKYLLALLNSKLLSFYYRRLFPEVGQVFSQVKLINLRQLPIKLLPSEAQQVMIAGVDELLAIGRDSSQTARRKSIEAQLDMLVYQGYHITVEQMQLVEQEFARSTGENP